MGWEISPTNWEDCHAGVYEPDANSYVAVVLDGPDAEANARLIAAAPDLLAVLKETYSHFKLWVEHDGWDDDDDDVMQKMFDAITKAGGN